MNNWILSQQVLSSRSTSLVKPLSCLFVIKLRFSFKNPLRVFIATAGMYPQLPISDIIAYKECVGGKLALNVTLRTCIREIHCSKILFILPLTCARRKLY